MRSRTPALLAASLLCAVLAAGPASAAQNEYLTPYAANVDDTAIGILHEAGVDIGHTGYKPGEGVQRIEVALYPSQAARVEDRGVDLTEVEIKPPAGSKTLRQALNGGDSPNPFYTVYRSYSEPGGIADEMRQIAREHRDIVKLSTIGRTTLGKPIHVLKITNNARNVADNTRIPVLFSSINHAREWIAAETARRLMNWLVDNRDGDLMQSLLRTHELWVMPIHNVDGYDYTFTCGVGPENRMCGPGEEESNRLWRKNLRDNNGNGIFGDDDDGVDPNRNYATGWNLDPEGSSGNPGSGTYRGPAPLSEPENLAYDRLLRKVDFVSLINYHSAAQLLLYPFGSYTDYSSTDDSFFKAITGTYGDAAVDPYVSQRSADLYVTNGETVEHGYAGYGVLGWTPELDERETGGGGEGSSFIFPDDESTVQAVFLKNLDFALNVAVSARDPEEPRNYDNNPSSYRVKPTVDIEPTPIEVSYGPEQTIEAIVKRSLGTVTMDIEGEDPDGEAREMLAIRLTEWEGGERLGDRPGSFFRRVRAKVPAEFPQIEEPGDDEYRPARPVAEGEVLTVTIRAGGQSQQFSFRVEALPEPDAEPGKRVLVVAAEDYTGVSPNRRPGYDVAPRYLDEHVEALEANGYDVEVYNVDDPPLNADGEPAPKALSHLGVLSHFDAVLYYTGDDFIPQDATNTDARHLATPTASEPSGSNEMSLWSFQGWIALRDYLNEGGKLVFAGRNAHNPFLDTSTGLNDLTDYAYRSPRVFGFFYPPDNAGDDRRPHTAYQELIDVSNDVEQYYFGAVALQGGYGSTQFNASRVLPRAGSIFDGMGPIVVDTGSGNDPNQDANGVAMPRAKSPLRMRDWSGVAVQKPLRQETIALDVENPPSQSGGVALTTRDTVVLGFGLEQVDGATRTELVRRSFAHLLPEGPDTTPPTVAFTYPSQLATVRRTDPVEVEVDAVDERGDMKEVALEVGGETVSRKVSFPFQLRYQPTAADVGRTVTLTAVAEDAAGNVATAERTVAVVSAAALAEAPLPAQQPSIAGTPAVGQQLACVNFGFLNEPTEFDYEWLRNGQPIAGATGPTYVPAAADLGRQIRCRVTASNDAGDADATSDFVVIVGAVQAPAGPAGSNGSTGPVGPQGPRGARGRTVLVNCRLANGRRAISCRIGTVGKTRARIRATARVAGTRIAKTRSGRNGKVRIRLRADRRFARTARVVVRVRVSGSAARMKVRLGRKAELTLRK
jgi:Zinc carboxypeptidase/Bacterial Ig domain